MSDIKFSQKFYDFLDAEIERTDKELKEIEEEKARMENNKMTDEEFKQSILEEIAKYEGKGNLSEDDKEYLEWLKRDL